MHVTIKAVVFDAYGTLYDVQSVAAVTEEAFPGYGEIITQIWRIKQLEYTWMRSLMRRYQDFEAITRDSLVYTLRVLGLRHDEGVFERIMDKYLHLDLYPDATAALAAMAIASSRSCPTAAPVCSARWCATPASTSAGRHHQRRLQKIFKPSPEVYSADRVGSACRPREVLFISSNPWDAARQGVRAECRLDRAGDAGSDGARLRKSDLVAPLTMFKALRTQMDELGVAARLSHPRAVGVAGTGHARA